MIGGSDRRAQDPHGRRRIAGEQGLWAHRAWLEVAPAIRTGAAQDAVDAVAAPGALVGADHRLRRVGWQVAITGLTVRAELQHGDHGATRGWPRERSPASDLAGAGEAGLVDVDPRTLLHRRWWADRYVLPQIYFKRILRGKV